MESDKVKMELESDAVVPKRDEVGMGLGTEKTGMEPAPEKLEVLVCIPRCDVGVDEPRTIGLGIGCTPDVPRTILAKDGGGGIVGMGLGTTGNMGMWLYTEKAGVDCSMAGGAWRSDLATGMLRMKAVL